MHACRTLCSLFPIVIKCSLHVLVIAVPLFTPVNLVLCPFLAPYSPSVSVSPLCLAPTLSAHTTKTPPSSEFPLSSKCRASIRSMLRWPQQCSPARRIHTNMHREEPTLTKQHALKYSWELWKHYKANMCGEYQALNIGSGVTAGMAQLWFSWSLLLSNDFDYFSFVLFCYSCLFFKTHWMPTVPLGWT